MTDPPFASRLKSALHEYFDSIAKEPLPDKWVELIDKLQERERKEAEARGRERGGRSRGSH
jgi:hypothetical protein